MGGDGRNSIGHELEIYDLQRIQVIRNLKGTPIISENPLWSPDGNNLLVHLAELTPSEHFSVEIKSDVYLIISQVANCKSLRTTSRQRAPSME